ncbi:hypothetical protein SAMN05421504_10748 [Amycolatopsis xylanica]|uniref:Uncharacterized protein n=1 Tax=Amycolatopsis xylanica TaxID=589385 RepID=A0A1H3MY74_9PSEU|nr:hypothetical protein [Amycolatopsis xylanica]SDY81430.1 hypothetical protein SAMN05421504_10748 [Amycolatopsis xylanica]
MTRIDAGFGYPLGFVATSATTVGSVSANATEHHLRSLAALAVVVCAISLVTRARAGLGTATVAWALHSGFVLGRSGEIVFTDEAGIAAMVLACAGVSGILKPAAQRCVRWWKGESGRKTWGFAQVWPSPGH